MMFHKVNGLAWERQGLLRLLVCVCVCVCERERERESTPRHIQVLNSATGGPTRRHSLE